MKHALCDNRYKTFIHAYVGCLFLGHSSPFYVQLNSLLIYANSFLILGEGEKNVDGN